MRKLDVCDRLEFQFAKKPADPKFAGRKVLVLPGRLGCLRPLCTLNTLRVLVFQEPLVRLERLERLEALEVQVFLEVLANLEHNPLRSLVAPECLDSRRLILEHQLDPENLEDRMLLVALAHLAIFRLVLADLRTLNAPALEAPVLPQRPVFRQLIRTLYSDQD